MSYNRLKLTDGIIFLLLFPSLFPFSYPFFFSLSFPQVNMSSPFPSLPFNLPITSSPIYPSRSLPPPTAKFWMFPTIFCVVFLHLFVFCIRGKNFFLTHSYLPFLSFSHLYSYFSFSLFFPNNFSPVLFIYDLITIIFNSFLFRCSSFLFFRFISPS